MTMNGFKDNFHMVGTNIHSHPYSMEFEPMVTNHLILGPIYFVSRSHK